MKIKLFLCLLLLCGSGGNCLAQQASESITISGHAYDFDARPIDGCHVVILNTKFDTLYSAITDQHGYYSIAGVEKGRYMALMAMRGKEYPRPPRVPEKDMRLEFWAWNLIADRDLDIDIRYHRLELYGFNVFKIEGGYPGMMAYVRPMSLGAILSSLNEKAKTDKTVMEKEIDLSVLPGDIEFAIYADDEPLKINSVQRVAEYVGGGTQYGYFIQMEAPKKKTDRTYYIFRITGLNKKHNERGENVYFYEIKDYKSLSRLKR